jgi:hypothetical protein
VQLLQKQSEAVQGRNSRSLGQSIIKSFPTLIIDIFTGLRKSIPSTESRFKAQTIDPHCTQSIATTGSCYNYKSTVSLSRSETVGLGPGHTQSIYTPTVDIFTGLRKSIPSTESRLKHKQSIYSAHSRSLTRAVTTTAK